LVRPGRSTVAPGLLVDVDPFVDQACVGEGVKLAFEAYGSPARPTLPPDAAGDAG
jgi:hypothetical protein